MKWRTQSLSNKFDLSIDQILNDFEWSEKQLLKAREFSMTVIKKTSDIHKYSRDDVEDALDSLKEELSLVIVMHEFEDISFKTIGYFLNLPETEVLKRYNEGMMEAIGFLNRRKRAS